MAQIIDNFKISSAKYLDARQKWATYADLVANTTVLMPNGFTVYVEADKKWYVMKTTDEKDPSKYTWKEFGASIQIETLPTITDANKDDYLGVLYQYIGTTTADYTYGHFYKGVEVKADAIITDESSEKFDAEVVDADKFIAVYPSGEYRVSYDGTQWLIDGSAVVLADIGLSVEGVVVAGDSFVVTAIAAGYGWAYTTTDKIVQYGTLDNPVPEAEDDNDGQIIQYVGKTAGLFQTGYFYKNTEVAYKKVVGTLQTETSYQADVDALRIKPTKIDQIKSATPTKVEVGEASDGTPIYLSYTVDGEDEYFTLSVATEDLKRVTISDSDDTFRTWKRIDVQPAGEDRGAVLKSDLKASVTVGGFEEGETVAEETSLETVLRKVLAPVTVPTFTVKTSSASTLVENGTTVTGPTITVDISAVGHEDKCLLNIYQGDTLILTDEDIHGKTGTYTATGTDFTADTTFKVVITASDANALEVVSKNQSIKYVFVEPEYYGLVDTDAVTETIITGLTKRISDKLELHISGITMTNKRICYAFPKAMGSLSKILDENGFKITSSFEVKEVTVGTVTYTVYVMADTATLSGGEITFVDTSSVTQVINDAVVTTNDDGTLDINIGDTEVTSLVDETAQAAVAQNSEGIAEM